MQLDAVGLSAYIPTMLRVFWLSNRLGHWAWGRLSVLNDLLDGSSTCFIRSTTYRVNGPTLVLGKKWSERGTGLSLDRQLDCPFILHFIDRMGLSNTFDKLSTEGAASSEWFRT